MVMLSTFRISIMLTFFFFLGKRKILHAHIKTSQKISFFTCHTIEADARHHSLRTLKWTLT